MGAYGVGISNAFLIMASKLDYLQPCNIDSHPIAFFITLSKQDFSL